MTKKHGPRGNSKLGWGVGFGQVKLIKLNNDLWLSLQRHARVWWFQTQMPLGAGLGLRLGWRLEWTWEDIGFVGGTKVDWET